MTIHGDFAGMRAEEGHHQHGDHREDDKGVFAARFDVIRRVEETTGNGDTDNHERKQRDDIEDGKDRSGDRGWQPGGDAHIARQPGQYEVEIRHGQHQEAPEDDEVVDAEGPRHHALLAEGEEQHIAHARPEVAQPVFRLAQRHQPEAPDTTDDKQHHADREDSGKDLRITHVNLIDGH
ncbi:MAG: hypothetical protein BWY76_02971 [bacterium ADurb.Bin429]|nr:MAG: hypothetical protein BWY76_02971 [bacterium ADurb.Bin429]